MVVLLSFSSNFQRFRSSLGNLNHKYYFIKKFSSNVPASTFKFDDLEIELVSPAQRLAKPKSSDLKFGHQFSDHMLQVKWTQAKGWQRPVISPIRNFSLHPGSKVFHYAVELFEGMKAYKGFDKKIRLFRPYLNMERMNISAKRSSLPCFDNDELLKCISKLVNIDKDWVPETDFSSLYIRPAMMGTEPSLGVAASKEAILYVVTGPVGAYFATGTKPVSLLADPQFVRSFHGGVGFTKMGSNYAPTIAIQKQAEASGHQQVLWLYGEDHQLTEVGTMNIFVYLINKDGEKELVTPPLDGIVLPGVTRDSLLTMSRSWNEFKVSERKITMNEITSALKENRLLEIFGSGTACVVCPVADIKYAGEVLEIPTMKSDRPLNVRLLTELTDIQYGKIKKDGWTIEVRIDD